MADVAPLPDLADVRIVVIGLGYVGLPLAVEFSKHFPTTGFDINAQRVAALQAGHDHTGETTPAELAVATRLALTTDAAALRGCNVFIVTVPTPVDDTKRPDFTPLIRASQTVGHILKGGDVVIYESTVYPGATEEICVPELERASGLACNRDFAVGYSPERINPGDKVHRLTTIPKVTSGSTPAAGQFVDALYRTIIAAGTHLAPSIKVAEASKIIENTQRDVNIALMNEFALIFQRLGIDTHDVLAAAGTKWNFLPFKPGLVGGHCIGVDPYYIIQKAQSKGYYPDLLLAARRINDGMGKAVADRVLRLMIERGIAIRGARMLILGFAFKENCADLRNTRVADLMREFEGLGMQVTVVDPWVDAEEARAEYGVAIAAEIPAGQAFDAVVLAVAHRQFGRGEGERLSAILGHAAVVFDVKGQSALDCSPVRL